MTEKKVTRYLPNDYSVDIVLYLGRRGIRDAAQRRKGPDSS